MPSSSRVGNKQRRWAWQKRLPTFEELAAAQTWNAVRAAKVARARELIADDDYPCESIVRSIARLMASHLS